MELLAKEVKEVEYTLKLTQTELNTLIVGFGLSSDTRRAERAELKELKILNAEDSYNLFETLSKHVEGY